MQVNVCVRGGLWEGQLFISLEEFWENPPGIWTKLDSKTMLYTVIASHFLIIIGRWVLLCTILKTLNYVLKVFNNKF